MNDNLRNRRELEFQKKVLAALQRPKPSRWLAVFNSRLFSVLVLGLFGTIGSIYFTSYQKCTADAERLSEAWYRLTREAMTRQDAIAWTVTQAKSMDDFRNIKYPNVYAEMKDKSLWEVLREKRQISRRIDFSPTRNMQIPATSVGDTKYSADELVRYGGIAVGNVPHHIKDTEIDAVRSFLMRYFNGTFMEYHKDIRIWLHPRCDFSSVAMSIVGRPTPIIVSSTTPVDGLAY
jgi:hypothetical protein